MHEHGNVSQKTVYEMLDALVRRLASRVTAVGEPYRYEAQPEPHDHAMCRICGRLYDIPRGGGSRTRARASIPEGFRVDRIGIAIRGVCALRRNQIRSGSPKSHAAQRCAPAASR